jgi:predicted XRE-type DNA-binding protein
MDSDNHKRKYLHLLEILNKKHAKVFTRKELSELLDVSERKLSDFVNGKLFDFNLLISYAGIIGENIIIELESEIK